MPISTPSSPPFVIKVGETVFNHNTNNIIRSVVVEDHVDMASFCSLMFDASIDQGQVNANIGDQVDVKLKTESHSVFKGEIISIDHSFQQAGTTTKIVRCIDRIHRLGRGRKTRFWNDILLKNRILA